MNCDNLEECIDAITIAYITEKKKIRNKRRLPRSFLRDLIHLNKEEFDIDSSIRVSMKTIYTIWQRYQGGNDVHKHQFNKTGPLIPLKDPEEALVSIIT